MMGLILDILKINDFYGISEEIDIAKGKNKLCLTVKEHVEQKKRRKWSKK